MSSASEKSIFLDALEKSSAREREAFLAVACADNPPLRAAVEELLHAHDRPQNVLDRAPVAVGAGCADVDDAAGSAAIAERPGSVIGPYTVREQIGEGGFGLVFVAEQQQPVRRKVALKIIKPGMDTREVIARFEAERQALALMDHPHIARVLDAGATDAGRPYFVMELVHGIALTDFCDQHGLTPRERLELFIHVCQAVQHAHQKGIIHRDLKPSNVLVTLHDGTPVAKVIDFGVAKAIGPRLTDKTIYTRFATMIGTPLYMSPEQAEMNGLDIDTRSDIYSLGVLMYELLSGTTPFDRDRLRSATFDEFRRILREEEPPRPSNRLTTPGQMLSTVAVQRKTDPRKLSALVRGDLDWIVMKALEKDRSRRYETAAALAADVRRFLDEQPIEARPPSPLYRLRKFARRNKAAVVTVSLVATALVLGSAISAWQAAQAIAERNQKETALRDAVLARNEADTARRRVEEFTERFKAANLLLASGRVHAVAERWPAALADYTHAVERQPDHYLVWSERGALYLRLGLWKLAAADFAKARDLGASPSDPAWWGVPQLFASVGDDRQFREICAQMARPFNASSGRLAVHEVRTLALAADLLTNPAELARQAEDWLQKSASRREPRRDDRFGPPPESPPADREPLPPRRNPPRGRPPNKPPGEDRPPPAQPGEFSNDRPARPVNRGTGSASQPRGAHLYVAGLAHYRAANYDRAIERLRESLNDGWPGRSIPLPVLAMAYHRRGQTDEARAALDAAKQAIDGWTESMLDSPVGAMPIPWFDWIECHLLYREANFLLTGFAPPDDPRLRAIEQRALAELAPP